MKSIDRCSDLIQEITHWIKDTHTPKDIKDLQDFTYDELKEIYQDILEEQCSRNAVIQEAFEGAVREINEDFEEEVYSMLDENGQWSFTILQDFCDANYYLTLTPLDSIEEYNLLIAKIEVYYNSHINKK